MCGEKMCVHMSWATQRGSPPRVRGKVNSAYAVESAFRITPACAGKSRYERDGKAAVKDHPRVCGEKRRMAGEVQALMGSPPRVRGKEGVCILTFLYCRITPACAGKRQYAVYPLCIYLGSPPRVRGKVDKNIILLMHGRITPACAGKSWAKISDAARG